MAAAFCGFVLNKTFVTWFLGQLVFIRDLPQPDFISNFGIGNFQANLWTMIFTVQFYIITAIIYSFLKNRKLWVWIFVMILSMALNLVVPHLQEILPETGRLIISHSCMPYFYMYLHVGLCTAIVKKSCRYFQNKNIVCDFVYCPCDLLLQVRCENRRVYGYDSSAFALPYDCRFRLQFR